MHHCHSVKTQDANCACPVDTLDKLNADQVILRASGKLKLEVCLCSQNTSKVEGNYNLSQQTLLLWKVAYHEWSILLPLNL